MKIVGMSTLFCAKFKLYFFLTIPTLISGLESYPCLKKDYGANHIVCVCNGKYCDTLEPISKVPFKQAVVYESNKQGDRFSKRSVKVSSKSEGNITVAVDRSEMYQFILGFGGAFTDSAGINIASLPADLQLVLMKGYFSSNGLEYTMGRVPMASCDFSTREYSYDDVPGDFSLKFFQLADEDFKYKIPYIKLAMNISKHTLLLFGSPWSAPAWMKTNGKMHGQGALIGSPGGKYYQTWADYFVKFLESYKSQNINFWGVTAQNEPTDGRIKDFPFQAMNFTAENQRDFIKMHLGPTLQKAGFGINNLKLMIMDDLRFLLPTWAHQVLNDQSAAQYISGIAFHWYLNFISPPKILDLTHTAFPDIFLLSSEACTGSYPWDRQKVNMGDWGRAEDYAHDIIQDLLHWTVGWIDWNLALNTEGGPNWVKNFVDAPVIVNATAKEFYRQPMFYAIAHFSKLLPPGSFRVGLNWNYLQNDKEMYLLDVAAFQTPTDATVVIVVNRDETEITFELHDIEVGYIKIVSPAHSIQSYIWWPNK